jgi:uncharacterized protein YdaU (DUF1376 family)
VNEKPPAFQFYPKAWMSSTAEMSLEAQGAYVRLLAWSWDNGPLPADEARRARLVGLTLARFRRVWSEFAAKWIATDAGLTNRRLEQQRVELEQYRQRQSAAGKASAAKRQPNSNQTPTTVEPPLQPEGKSSSSSSSPTSKEEIKSGRARDDAEPVWTNRPSSRHGGLIGNHRGCFNGPGGPAACARGLCVPNWLGQQWTQQYGDDRQRADREIAAFITAMVDGIPPGPIGDLGKDFWPAAWKATHGSQAPRASMSRTGDTVDAGKRFLAKRFAQLKAEEGDAHVAGQIES